jgi:hypothetical protein
MARVDQRDERKRLTRVIARPAGLRHNGMSVPIARAQTAGASARMRVSSARNIVVETRSVCTKGDGDLRSEPFCTRSDGLRKRSC